MLGLIGEVISLRSFSSLWYWVAVAVFWLWVSGRVLGISFGLVHRGAAGGDGQKLLEVLAHAQARHWIMLWSRWKMAWVAGSFAVLTGLSSLAFSYGIELAQALWFLAIPYMGLLLLQLRVAMRILAENRLGDGLISLMYRTRFAVQLIGFVFILLTASFAFLVLLINGYFR